eukprot:5647220-Alexandrium_andersonii.AAC.1
MENGDPSIVALGAGGTARSAAPSAHSADTSGSPFSADSTLWARTFRLVGPAGTAASSIWK